MEKANVLQFHPQAKALLASSGFDGKLLLWDLSSLSVCLSMDRLPEPVCLIVVVHRLLRMVINSSSAWHGALMELS